MTEHSNSYVSYFVNNHLNKMVAVGNGADILRLSEEYIQKILVTLNLAMISCLSHPKHIIK